jgi:polyhydroxyalkanoate synthesis regulator phasin
MDRETKREDAEKEINRRVSELTNTMKAFRDTVDNLEKTVHSLEVRVVDYIHNLNKAKDEIEMQYNTNK